MTIRDPEVLEALRDEPELLAIADAVVETQPSARHSRRRAVSRSAAVVAVGAAVLAAVLLWPNSGGGRNRILDRAQAAIGNGPVLHLITSVPAGEELVDIRTGRSTVPTYEMESWSDRDLKRVHTLLRIDGRIVGEVLLPQDGDSDIDVDVDPAYVALWTGYREALASGTAKIEREGTLYGHAVYWLVFPAPGGGSARNEVAIDRKTYQPLEFRFRTGSTRQDERVLLARTEPFSTSAFTRLTSGPSPLSGETTQSSGVVEEGSGRPGNVPKGWLDAGPTIGGLKLSGVSRTQEASGEKTGTGLELFYGSAESFRRSVTIDETRSPVDPTEWKAIPKGSIRITKGGGSDNGGEYVVWSGYLVEDGVYVTIQTAVSRAAVLESARALRPA